MKRFRVFAAANGGRAVAAAALLAAAGALGGCDEAGDGLVLTAEPMCSVRVIVRFAAEPDAAALAEIQRANELELAPLAAITDDMRVYLLRTAGLDADCRAAIERLRSDRRLRSVELDARRELHDRESLSKEESP